MSNQSQNSQGAGFSASHWLQTNLGSWVEARANLEEYTSIDVTVKTKGKPDRHGTSWTFDAAVQQAVEGGEQ